jgi:hypothetical protein
MLQSSIQDNQVSLSDVVREIDKVLEGDVTSALVSYFVDPSPHPFSVRDLQLKD